MRRTRSLILLVTVCAVVLAGPAAGSRATPARQAGLEAKLLVKLNAVRGQHGLKPLRLSQRLNAAADRHSFEMARDGYFAHASADGTSFWKRVERFYPAAGYRSWAVGENLVWRSPDLDASEAIDLWMASPPHRENMLDPSWRQVGFAAVRVAAAPGTYDGMTVTIVTADFGTRAK